MIRYYCSMSTSITGAVLLALSVMQVHAETLAEAVTGSKTSLDILYRLETVEQDNALQDATASTVRTSLGYKTGTYQGFSAFIEMEDIHAVGDEDYNVPGVNTNPTYSAVPDLIGTELNQSYLQYSAWDTTARFGRQQIILDNARFVGNVGWRQNRQTYDSLYVSNKSVENLEIVLAYITNVNGITFNDINHDDIILNVGYSGWSFGKLSFYYYGIEDQGAPNASVETTGLRFSGATGMFLYTAEFASQQDYADSTVDIDADYSLIEAGIKFGAFTVKLGVETLGTGVFDGFETPLATKHAFNGWADIFLNTPPAGIVDTYVSAGGAVAGFNLLAFYHDYVPDASGNDYGTELNFLVTRKFSANYSGGIKYASYDADSFGVDTDKMWFFLQASFN